MSWPNVWPGGRIYLEDIPCSSSVKAGNTSTQLTSIMGKLEFRFDGEKGDKFEIDLADVDTVDTLQRLIGRDFGVVKPEGRFSILGFRNRLTTARTLIPSQQPTDR